MRETYIPEAVKDLKKLDKSNPNRPRLAREVEEMNGGAGVFSVNLKERYLLDNDDWKEDKVPEIFDGKNVADYVDPDIEAKLVALEEEEERLQAEGFYDSDDSMEDDEEEEIRNKAEQIREKRQLIRNENKMRKSLKNRAVMPRSALRKKLSTMEDKLDELGFDTRGIGSRVRAQSRGRSAVRSRGGTADAMDVDKPESKRDMLFAKARLRSQSNRREDGVTSLTARSKAERLAKLSQKKMNRMARQGEADRHIPSTKPKHLAGLHETYGFGWLIFCSCLESALLERLNVVRLLIIIDQYVVVATVMILLNVPMPLYCKRCNNEGSLERQWLALSN